MKMLSILLLLFVCHGCRTNTLTITTKAYKESISMVLPPGEEEVNKKVNDLIQFINDVGHEKKSFASNVAIAYGNISRRSGSNLKELNSKYIDSLNTRQSSIRKDLVRTNLEYAAGRIPDSLISKRIAALTLDIYDFATKKTNYEATLDTLLLGLNGYLQNKSVKDRAAEQIRILSDTVKAYKYLGDPTQLRGKTPEQLNALRSTSHFLNTYGNDMLVRYGQSSNLYNDIMNMQDLSNPAWITVLHSVDTDWKTQGKPVSYEANGNSSVVFVRENPISYKIHEGANDPSAVIRTQLHVTRAFANAATSVLSGAYGLNLNVGESVDAEQQEQSVKDIARLNVEADLGLVARQHDLESLDEQLEAIRLELSLNRSKKEEVDKLKTRLKELLEFQTKKYASDSASK